MTTSKSQIYINDTPSSSSRSSRVIETQETPLPLAQITILLIVRFAEPVAFTIFFPFMFQMIKDFHLSESEDDIGYFAGMVASSFAIAQFLSGVPWGMLSDRIGRRPVILMGLLGTASSLTLFGMSRSLPWAIVTRSLCGLLNGNVGVVKSMMAELTDSTNRARGFSLLPMMFGLGCIIGPALGGFLSKPVENYPNFIPSGFITDFLTEFPYFLPCFISSLLCLFSCIFGFFYLEETLDMSHNALTKENSPLLKPKSAYNVTKSTSETTLCNYGALKDDDIKDKGLKVDSNETLKVKFYIAKSSSQTSLESQTIEKNESIPSASWMTMLGYIGLSLQTVMQDELLPVWASTTLVKGGLSFSSQNIGLVYAFGGISLLFIQILFYAPMQKKLGTLPLFRYVFVIYTPVVLMYPVANAVAVHSSSSILWLYILILTTLRTGCGVFGFTSVNILLAETCPNKRILGKVNGLAQCLGSLMRSFGPALTGVAYSWSLKNGAGSIIFGFPFTWIIIAFISFLNLLISRTINDNDLVLV